MIEGIDPMAFSCVELSEAAKAGTFPESGGMLDQSAFFIAAHRHIQADVARIETEAVTRAMR